MKIMCHFFIGLCYWKNSESSERFEFPNGIIGYRSQWKHRFGNFKARFMLHVASILYAISFYMAMMLYCETRPPPLHNMNDFNSVKAAKIIRLRIKIHLKCLFNFFQFIGQKSICKCFQKAFEYYAIVCLLNSLQFFVFSVLNEFFNAFR